MKNEYKKNPLVSSPHLIDSVSGYHFPSVWHRLLRVHQFLNSLHSRIPGNNNIIMVNIRLICLRFRENEAIMVLLYLIKAITVYIMAE